MRFNVAEPQEAPLRERIFDTVVLYVIGGPEIIANFFRQIWRNVTEGRD